MKEDQQEARKEELIVFGIAGGRATLNLGGRVGGEEDLGYYLLPSFWGSANAAWPVTAVTAHSQLLWSQY